MRQAADAGRLELECARCRWLVVSIAGRGERQASHQQVSRIEQAVGGCALRTASRSTTARPDSAAGAERSRSTDSTTPAGRSFAASKTGVRVHFGFGDDRAARLLGGLADSTIAATFCFSRARRRAWSARPHAGGQRSTAAMARRKSAVHDFDADASVENCITRQRAAETARFALARAVVRPVGLAGARHQLELAALHLLLEHAELRLLADVEHLIDRVVRLARLGRRRGRRCPASASALLDLRLVGLLVVQQPLRITFSTRVRCCSAWRRTSCSALKRGRNRGYCSSLIFSCSCAWTSA